MAKQTYDAIVVGARCAGSPTAMLLARKGYKVLLVDKATFPSDTISTHLIHPPGIAALKRWGLADRVIATGCPPVHTYTFDFGAFTIAGSPGTPESPVAYCPRRTVLDKILVDAAAEAGAEVREEFTVEDIVSEDGRVTGIRGRGKGIQSLVEHSRVVIGADGRHSVVAKAVKPEQYNEKPQLLAAYYTYWSGLPMNSRFETYARERCGFAAVPTNDDLTLVIAGWSFSEFEEKKKDVEGNYHRTLENAPEFAERVRAAKREERFSGTPVPGYFRKPYGPGWALVGDAAYNKDFITAMGISDAFYQAEMCVNALDESLAGTRPFDAAMGAFQVTRDRHYLPVYEFTAGVASLEPLSPEQQQLFEAISRSREASDGYVRVNSGDLSPADFFNPENVARIFAAASARTAMA